MINAIRSRLLLGIAVCALASVAPAPAGAAPGHDGPRRWTAPFEVGTSEICTHGGSELEEEGWTCSIDVDVDGATGTMELAAEGTGESGDAGGVGWMELTHELRRPAQAVRYEVVFDVTAAHAVLDVGPEIDHAAALAFFFGIARHDLCATCWLQPDRDHPTPVNLTTYTETSGPRTAAGAPGLYEVGFTLMAADGDVIPPGVVHLRLGAIGRGLVYQRQVSATKDPTWIATDTVETDQQRAGAAIAARLVEVRADVQ